MLTTKKIIFEAPKLWRHLNGIITVYKPAGLSMKQVQSSIISNICRDLNELGVRPPKQIVTIDSVSNGASGESKYIVNCKESLTDNVLVVGQRYQPVDFKSVCSLHLGKFTSGVLILGINQGIKTAYKIRENRPIRVYHVTGKFGWATESHFNDSSVTVRASFDHIYLNKLNSLLASLQASHQKKMFEMCGVDIQTQAAFELVALGPLRPTVTNIPLIYGLRCIDFKKPYFTIEIHAVNESEAYLGILMHEIGLNLKTVAHCTQIRCIRQSHLTLEHSLTRMNWNVESVLNNMTLCQSILRDHPEMLKQIDPTLNIK